MSNYDKEYVLLKDGKPMRYYKDGQIKTYQSRANAEKQAKIEIKDAIKRNEYWERMGKPEHKSAIPTFKTAKFAAVDVETVYLDGRPRMIKDIDEDGEIYYREARADE